MLHRRRVADLLAIRYCYAFAWQSTMNDEAEQRRQFAIAATQQALGAVRFLSPTQMVADVVGRRVELVLRTQVAGGGESRPSRREPNRLLELRFPLAVPIKFGLNMRSNYVHVGPVPIFTTGDPEFDGVYVVAGAPSEVVQRAFDAPTRAWIQHYGQPHLMLQTDDGGALSFLHPVLLPHEGHRRPLTPQAVFDAANALSHFANALEAGYRARRAEIVAQQGERGALAWEEHNKGLIAARPLRWLRWVLAGCLVLLVLGILAATAMFAMALL